MQIIKGTKYKYLRHLRCEKYEQKDYIFYSVSMLRSRLCT